MKALKEYIFDNQDDIDDNITIAELLRMHRQERTSHRQTSKRRRLNDDDEEDEEMENVSIFCYLKELDAFL